MGDQKNLQALCEYYEHYISEAKKKFPFLPWPTLEKHRVVQKVKTKKDVKNQPQEDFCVILQNHLKECPLGVCNVTHGIRKKKTKKEKIEIPLPIIIQSTYEGTKKRKMEEVPRLKYEEKKKPIVDDSDEDNLEKVHFNPARQFYLIGTLQQKDMDALQKDEEFISTAKIFVYFNYINAEISNILQKFEKGSYLEKVFSFSNQTPKTNWTLFINSYEYKDLFSSARQNLSQYICTYSLAIKDLKTSLPEGEEIECGSHNITTNKIQSCFYCTERKCQMDTCTCPHKLRYFLDLLQAMLKQIATPFRPKVENFFNKLQNILVCHQNDKSNLCLSTVFRGLIDLLDSHSLYWRFVNSECAFDTVFRSQMGYVDLAINEIFSNKQLLHFRDPNF